ncbi:MAG TPA: hypothetical protein VFX42_00645 [Gemmatimonadales bacterium]|nr:hypothetical protein [Gemmatimonadales bacterium]
MSGYRAESTHRLTFDTDYSRVYQALMAEDESRLVRGVEDPFAESL